MSALLSWKTANGNLTLCGELSSQTLLPLWQQRAAVLTDIAIIDVAQLQHVDSAGLALLLQLYKHCLEQKKKLIFTGINERLATLITLYNLQHILPVELSD